MNPNERWTEGFRGVAVTLRDKSVIRGVARNYSNYSYQVMDADGKLHLLPASSIEKVEWSEKSLMPDHYKQKLAKQDLQNIIAFLSRQAVKPEVEATRANR